MGSLQAILYAQLIIDRDPYATKDVTSGSTNGVGLWKVLDEVMSCLEKFIFLTSSQSSSYIFLLNQWR